MTAYLLIALLFSFMDCRGCKETQIVFSLLWPLQILIYVGSVISESIDSV